MRIRKNWWGFLRSWFVYEAYFIKSWKKKKLYKTLIKKGDLTFDIGGHLGDRSSTFLSLGAKVICVEPQRLFHPYLQWKFRKNASVKLIFDAIGSQEGNATFHVNSKYPTLSTLSASEWKEKLGDSTSQTITYDQKYTVKVITLEQLIRRFGLPNFCKIDVEGFEYEVLKGMNTPIPIISFEFISFAYDEMERCLLLLKEKGYSRFNWCFREEFKFKLPKSISSIPELSEHIKRHQKGTFSGDIYAWHKDSI